MAAPRRLQELDPQGLRLFEQQMKAAGIPVTLNLHDGGHDDRLKERIAEYALPFFDKLLSSGSWPRPIDQAQF